MKRHIAFGVFIAILMATAAWVSWQFASLPGRQATVERHQAQGEVKRQAAQKALDRTTRELLTLRTQVSLVGPTTNPTNQPTRPPVIIVVPSTRATTTTLAPNIVVPVTPTTVTTAVPCPQLARSVCHLLAAPADEKIPVPNENSSLIPWAAVVGLAVLVGFLILIGRDPQDRSVR